MSAPYDVMWIELQRLEMDDMPALASPVDRNQYREAAADELVENSRLHECIQKAPRGALFVVQ